MSFEEKKKTKNQNLFIFHSPFFFIFHSPFFFLFLSFSSLSIGSMDSILVVVIVSGGGGEK